MCGLVGVAGEIVKVDKDAFRMLLHLDIIRGPHSTGVASVETNGGWSLVKKKGTAWDLYDSSEFNTLMARQSYALIGHNRYATKGKVNSLNAHPFEFENVVGAHNGTIRQQKLLPEHTRFEVDSENIFYSIQTEGLEETLSKLAGAYALTYWDSRTDDLVLLRNKERTLFYCFSQDRQTVYWASEKWMLSVALSRAGIQYEEILEIAAGFIYRFNFDRSFKPKHEVSVNIQAFEEYTPPKPVGAAQGAGKATTSGKHLSAPANNAYQGPTYAGRNVEFLINGEAATEYGQNYLSGELIEDPRVEVRIYLSKGTRAWEDALAVCADTVFGGNVLAYRAKENFVTIESATFYEVVEDDEGGEYEDTFLGFENKLLTESGFYEKTKKGCAWCSNPVTIMDAKFIQWIKDDEFFCSDCSKLDEPKEYAEGL